jgi:dienelactone hydrolase
VDDWDDSFPSRSGIINHKSNGVFWRWMAMNRAQVYGSLHGWCVSDMPLQNGKPIYDMADAERAWGKLVTLYKTALA